MIALLLALMVAAAPPGSGWQLAWSDDFADVAIDPAKWTLANDCWGGGNNEQQCYTSRAAQEDARQFTWTGPGTLAIDGPPVNLTRQLDESFVLLPDWRIDHAVPGPILISFGGGSIDMGDSIRAAEPGKIIQTRIPLHCFRDAGANLAAVGSPLKVTAPAGFAMTLRTARAEAIGMTMACPAKH